MSINSLANAAAARRTDFAPAGTVPRGWRQIAGAAYVHPYAFGDVPPKPDDGGLQVKLPADGGNEPPPAANEVNTALHILFGYIPTEILTLYVAVLAAIHQPGKITAADNPTFWAFLIATPIVVWLVYAAKIKMAKKALPFWPSQWPVWEMFAGTVAYVAWAFALPESPFSTYSWYSSALSGLVVLVVSTVLGLLAPLFQRPIKP